MLLLNSFPQTAALAPAAPIWSLPFRWGDHFDLTPLVGLWAIQVELQRNLPRFWAWTEAMVSDLVDQRAATPAAEDAIDCARFITCQPALHATQRAGQLGACFDWVWTAIAHTHIRMQRVNNNVINFANFPSAPQDLFDLYLREIPNFASALFYVAYKFGGLDELTSMVAPACWVASRGMYHLDPPDEIALQAMIQMTIWASHRDMPEGPTWAAELLRVLEAEQKPEHRKLIAMTFRTPAHRYTSDAPQVWAERILAELEGALVEHERLQVLAVSIRGAESWAARRSTVLAEIARLRISCLTQIQSGESDLEVLEQRASVLHPLIHSLLNWGDVDDIADVLGAWYRAPGAEASNSDLLAVIPTHDGAAAYLWPTGRLLAGTGDFATHDAMQRASGRALGAYYRGTDGDHTTDDFRDFRFDVVKAEEGYALEDAIKAHYRFDELAERLPPGWIPRSVVIFPSGPEPIQALLAKTIGLEAPLEISFERAQARRPIRRVSVWAGGPWHETFELEAICHIANRVGWTLDIHRPEAPTAEDLRTFYEDASSDLLWVISHGAHDPFAIRGTGVHLSDETLVTLDEMRTWHVPGEGRRLLILNSCSGAAAQGRGALARIGLAQSLVSGRQAVVGHLWPIHWSAGLAFGAVLAACLGTDPTDSAVFAATTLMREPNRLIAFLEDAFRGCDELLLRVRRSSEDLGSLTVWGCPVLLT